MTPRVERSVQDVALYGVLCGLASLERNEIQTILLESSNFRECLDLVPCDCWGKWASPRALSINHCETSCLAMASSCV